MQSFPEVINTILVLYSAILIMNCCTYLFFWKKEGENLYKLGVILWITTFLNFFLQGIFTDLNIYTVVNFSTYFFAAVTISGMIKTLLNEKLDLKHYSLVYIGCLAISIGLSFVTRNFTILALPVALAVAYPMLRTSMTIFFNQDRVSIDINFLSGIVFIQSLLFVDYPFLRPFKESALFGFSFALFILILFSIIIPSIIVRFRMLSNNDKLREEIKRRKELEETLVLALDEKKRVNSGKDQFLSKISHEIRTPMNAIIGTGSLLQDSELSREQNDYLDAINKSSEKLLTNLNDILTFVSVSSKGRLKINTKVHSNKFNQNLKKVANDINKDEIDISFT
jgi:signal transduction histidine kinase